MSEAPRDMASGQGYPALSRDPVVVVESTLAILAIVLAMTLVVVSIPEDHSRARRDPPAAGTVAPTATTDPVPGTRTPSLVGSSADNLGFEAGTAGWEPVGAARVERVSAAREAHWAASIARGTSASPGITLPRAWHCQPGRSYAATVWLRSSAPGTAVTFNLVELFQGRRVAVDTVRTVLRGTGWQRVQGSHVVRRPGSWLAVEILANGLPRSANLLVDGLEIAVKRVS
jgi:hypothetical protein